MNCLKCGTGLHVTDVIHEPDFDHEGEIERDEDGYEIWIEYEIFACEQCQHEARRFTRHLAEDELPDGKD